MRAARLRRDDWSFMGPRLTQVLVPEFLQALERDRERRAQLLREEGHAKLLEEPAELLELRVGAAGFAVGLRALLVVVPEPGHGERVLLVALGVGAVFLQPQRVALQVARNVLQAFPWRARNESGIHEPFARRLHVLHDAAQRAALRHDLRVMLARLDDRGE